MNKMANPSVISILYVKGNPLALSTLDVERAAKRIRNQAQPVPCAGDGFKAAVKKHEKFTHSHPAEGSKRKG